MKALESYFRHIIISSKKRLLVETIKALFVLILAFLYDSKFNIILSKFHLLDRYWVVLFIVIIAVLSTLNIVYAFSEQNRSEGIFLKSIGFTTINIKIIQLFSFRFSIAFEGVLLFAFRHKMGVFMTGASILLFIIVNKLAIMVIKLTQKKFLFKSSIIRNWKLPNRNYFNLFSSNKLISLLKLDMSFLRNVYEVKIFIVIYLVFNVFTLYETIEYFIASSTFFVFFVSVAAEKMIKLSRQLKILYKSLGISFTDFFISKYLSVILVVTTPVLLMMLLRSFYFEEYGLTIFIWIGILCIYSFLNILYWVSLYMNYWYSDSDLRVILLSFCVFIFPLNLILPFYYLKSSSAKWEGVENYSSY